MKTFTLKNSKKRNSWKNWSYVKKGAILGFATPFGLFFIFGWLPFILFGTSNLSAPTRSIVSLGLTMASIFGIIGAAIGTIIGIIINKVKGK